MKKKILVFHPALAPYRVDFFNSLHEAFNVSFYFSLTNVPDQKFDQEALKRKCRFQIYYLLNGFELFGRSFRSGIVSIIRKENPNIILCSEYGSITVQIFFYKIIFRKKFKLYTLSDDSISNSISRKGVRALIRYVVSKSIDGIIFPSEEVCQWYKKHISAKTKTLELPIIHNEEIFRNQLSVSIDTSEVNIRKHNLKHKKVLLFVGRLVEAKNLTFLIKVVAQLKSINWVLVIVGSGVLLNDLINEAANLNLLDKILFVGRKEGVELVSWYNIANIFILPSIYEPFGAVVNEALLGGCKVLCSDLAGASSLINKNNGWTFNPYLEHELVTYLDEDLKQVEPIDDKIILRPSLMPFTFKDKVDRLINDL